VRVLVTIQHPAHVHFFRHSIAEWLATGHAVRVCVREKSVATALLDAYGIEYRVLSDATTSILDLAVTQVVWEARLLREARQFDPDVLVAIAEPGVTHVARLVGARSVVFSDTEHSTIQNRLAFPFAHRVCVPDCFYGRLPRTARTYPGYHELAYLHPDRFRPSPEVLEQQGLDPDDELVVLRTVAWDAAHDFGASGLSGLEGVVDELESTGATVVISAEAPLPEELADRRYTGPPAAIHHLLAHATLVVGEGATTAAEAAVLGTPAIFISEWELGYTRDLQRYGLLFNYVAGDRETRQRRGIDRAVRLLSGESEETDWAERRRRLLADKRDTTTVIREQVADLVSEQPTPRDQLDDAGEVRS
jgi:hypothetical protein